VIVDWKLHGALPQLPAIVRRGLVEAPLRVLATATPAGVARVTVVGRRDEVTVGVIATSRSEVPPTSDIPGVHVDGQREGERLWVESRWRAR